MANSLISMIKGDSTLINNTEVLDGQVLFNTDEKTILLDDDNTRTKYCGADKSNKNLAPIENGNTATRGYAAGSYVVWKEQLYKVLTQINSGTAFVVGTNIALDTVGAELTQLNSDLANKQDKSDNNLNTTEKTVVGAINELLGKTQISNLKSISSSYTFANLLSDIQTLKKPIYFTNWYETTNFPFMYGAGIGIRGLDGNNITIIYTSAVSGLCAIYSHSVQIPNGEWNTLNKWGMSIAVSLPSDAQWHSYTAPYDGEMCIRAYSKQHINGTAAAQIGSAGFYFRLAYDFSAPDGYNDANNAKVTIIPLKKGETLYMYAESNVVVTDCRFTY